jgi:hypothetical protein
MKTLPRSREGRRSRADKGVPRRSLGTRRRDWHPCRGATRRVFFPVVSPADGLNHRLMDWQASGLQGGAR